MDTKLIPSFFVMQVYANGGPYLTVLESPSLNRPPGVLKFEVNQILSPLAKFQAENAKQPGNESLYHIRSCYNNKYWVVRQSQGQSWIAASADKPQEDRTSPECTLFRPDADPKGLGFRLFNINRSMYVRNVTGDTGGLQLATSGETFPTVDWGTLAILPTRVAFKLENTDKFLCSRTIEGYSYLRFESGLGSADPVVANELVPTDDGFYRIKNMHFGKFWRLEPNWIWADANESDKSQNTLFQVSKVSNSVIAIRNMRNNNYCGGYTTEGKTDCLNAAFATITPTTRLNVVERVLSREISDITYHLPRARAFDEKVLEVDSGIARNNTSQESTITLKLTESNSKTSTWNNSNTVTVGMSLKISVTLVPEIVTGEVQISAQGAFMYSWGESNTTDRKREFSHAVKVPPNSAVKVTLMCKRGSCEVPFSYRQTDVLTDGSRISVIKDDGLYTGENSYSFETLSSKV